MSYLYQVSCVRFECWEISTFVNGGCWQVVWVGLRAELSAVACGVGLCIVQTVVCSVGHKFKIMIYE